MTRNFGIALGVVGILGLLGAGYLYSFGVPVEAGCHSRQDVACPQIHQLMTQAAVTAGMSIGFLVVAIVLFVRGRRAAR